jgi:uncharacterized surface protein with fasciclin (FAS1) repeats
MFFASAKCARQCVHLYTTTVNIKVTEEKERLTTIVDENFVSFKEMGVKKIKDIVDTALESDSFKTLCKAVIATGLVEPLKGDGPFTVFAPTDAAFAKLPAGTVDALLKDKKKLTEILKYHVVPQKLTLTDLKIPKSFKTLQGQEIKVDGMMWHINKKVKVNDARTVKTDIQATNGIIQAIDSVLMPK